jgi:hypothetical protein
LAVASGFLAWVSSGEAAGSVVAAAGDGDAFGAGAGAALAVASGFLAWVSSSDEVTGSAVAAASCFPIALGVAVDPGGHVIQHSAPAGNDSHVNPVTDTSKLIRRDFAFMIHPPFVFDLLFTLTFRACSRSGKQSRKTTTLGFPALNLISPFLAGRGLVSDKFRAVGSGNCLPDRYGSR